MVLWLPPCIYRLVEIIAKISLYRGIVQIGISTGVERELTVMQTERWEMVVRAFEPL